MLVKYFFEIKIAIYYYGQMHLLFKIFLREIKIGDISHNPFLMNVYYFIEELGMVPWQEKKTKRCFIMLINERREQKPFSQFSFFLEKKKTVTSTRILTTRVLTFEACVIQAFCF